MTVKVKAPNEDAKIKRVEEVFWDVHDGPGCGPCSREEYLAAYRRKKRESRRVTA
jgi:hypothetical protein